MNGRQKPLSINALTLLIGIGGIMDLQFFVCFFINPMNLLFALIEALKRALKGDREALLA